MEAALFITDTPTESQEKILAFLNVIRRAGIKTCTFHAGRLSEIEAEEPACALRPDVAISIGGDGTFLRAARRMAPLDVPVVGVNAGHLGFLPQFSLDDGEELASALLQKSLHLEERMLLAIECEAMPEDIWPYALNEIALLKEETSSMLSIDVSADGDFVARYLADGLLVSTPTGSTAYSLAAGGPLVNPASQCQLLVPVAPHTLTLRPMVLPAATRLRLEPESRTGRCRISLDGFSFILECPAPLEVSRAPFSLKVLLRPGSSFFSTLRSKLHWAQR